MLNQLKITYPKTLPDVLQQTPAQFEEEAKWAMAAKLYEMKRLSSGMAAELVGCDGRRPVFDHRVTFIMNLHRFNVPVLEMSETELLSDIENA